MPERFMLQTMPLHFTYSFISWACSSDFGGISIGQPLLQPISAFAGQLPRASPSFRGLLQCGQVMHLHCFFMSQGRYTGLGLRPGRSLAESDLMFCRCVKRMARCSCSITLDV